MTKKQGLVGRTHKAGTGACKKQAAARKLTVGGHKHTSLIGVPKPHAKPPAKPRTRVEEPPATGARTRSMPHDDVWLQADMCANPRYAQNKECDLWPIYEGENDWKILELVPKTNVDKKVARASQKHVLAASTARMAAGGDHAWRDRLRRHRGPGHARVLCAHVAAGRRLHAAGR